VSLKDLRARAESRDMRAEFVPASRVETMQEYRNKRGERIGMPARPRELSDADFADIVMSGLDKQAGPLSGFGNFLVEQGHPDEVYGGSDRTTLPTGNVAEQDLYEDGTPGAGYPIDEEDESFDTLKSSGRQIAARRTMMQWMNDLKVLEARFDEIQEQAQILENKGDLERAAILDRQSINLGKKILSYRDKIAARRNYESEMMRFEDAPSGLSELFDEEY